MSDPERLTGEIYDLCNLALSALEGEIDSTSNGLRFLVTEIQERNTRLYDMAAGRSR